MRNVRMEDEGKMDFFESLSNKSPSKAKVTKNILRPVYADGSDVSSGKLCKACATWPTVPGTKKYHQSVAAELALVEKEDKCRGKEKDFKVVTSKLGKKVRVGKTVIVKKTSILPDPVEFKGVKPTKKTLKNVLRGM